MGHVEKTQGQDRRPRFGGSREHGGHGPVSYTHLDVYKIQMLMVLAAYAAAALAGSSRSAALVIVAVWLFFALVWDPNVPQLVLQRGLPLLVLCLLCACVWRALGASEYAWRKLGGAR